MIRTRRRSTPPTLLKSAPQAIIFNQKKTVLINICPKMEQTEDQAQKLSHLQPLVFCLPLGNYGWTDSLREAAVRCETKVVHDGKSI